jgi:DNA-3-methyladenine glycosylase
LLGAVLEFGTVAVRLTEVEAYCGTGDPASHSVSGPTAAKRALFGVPGTLYCYFSYGMHVCGNVVCEAEGSGSAVLLRAGEVVSGVEIARERRGFITRERRGFTAEERHDPIASARTRPDSELARGPGCLGQAMGWTLAHSGLLLGRDFTITVPTTTPGVVRTGPRVGVSTAHERPWRFWLDGEPSVSSYKRSPRAH